MDQLEALDQLEAVNQLEAVDQLKAMDQLEAVGQLDVWHLRCAILSAACGPGVNTKRDLEV